VQTGIKIAVVIFPRRWLGPSC